MLAKMWSNRNLSLLAGMQSITATLANSLAVCLQTKTYSYHIIQRLTWHLPNELKMYVHTNQHADAYSSFIHNFQNLEATKDIFQQVNALNKLWLYADRNIIQC